MSRLLLGLFLLSPLCLAQEKSDSLNQLASEFWTWRAECRHLTFDDVPRMEHADGTRDWSAAITKRRVDLSEFERRWKIMRTDRWPVGRMVDYRLVGETGRVVQRRKE
jgi:hypothetical protein